MKISVLAAIAALAAGASCQAAGLRSAPGAQLYTCESGPLSRVAMLAVPVQCCDGKLQCPQFLSTTTLLKPKHDPRT